MGICSNEVENFVILQNGTLTLPADNLCLPYIIRRTSIFWQVLFLDDQLHLLPSHPPFSFPIEKKKPSQPDV